MSDMAQIDRRSPVPFYSQLKRLVLADIALRGIEPGDRLDGEHELCQRYDVSRTVVRQALQELEHEGVVRREKGRGTFLSDPRSSRGIGGALVGTFEDIQGQAGEQRSHVIRKEVLASTPHVALDLRLTPGESVVEIERIREVDGIPWALTRTQLPLDIGRPLMKIELEDVSLFGLLERDFGIRFERASRSVEAEVATESIARALDMPVGSPVLVMRSLSFDREARPIERFTGYHRGDRSRLDIEVGHLPT